MKMQSDKHGAALIIVLGFLSILTITIIAFSTQTRSERLAGRAFTSTAQTRHLLNTALTRARVDIDSEVTDTPFPPFFAFGSQGTVGSRVATTVDFSMEEDYFSIGNKLIEKQYDTARNKAEWQTVADLDNIAIGRIGYIVINSSGLLDANEVGGVRTGEYIERKAGVSPKEIQLSNNAKIIDEFNASATIFKHFDANHSGGVLRSSSKNDLSPALAFIYNRENAWHRFETLRDVYLLNRIKPLVITTDIESFSTFSYDPRKDFRTFMGTNTESLATAFIREELDKMNTADSDFVINQLLDYLDTDTIPEDENGNYTDLSVEPVPLINEIALTCDFTFFPQVEETEDENGNIVIDVTSVIISNLYKLELEIWYPFVGFSNTESYYIHIEASPIESDQLPVELFGDITDWVHEQIITPEDILPSSKPFNFSVTEDGFGTEVFSQSEMLDLFQSMQSDIQFPVIYCDTESGKMVDRVKNLELPMVNAVSRELIPIIEELAERFFIGNSTAVMSNQLDIGMACVDPRLNWDGTSPDQWKAQMDAGKTASASTMGKINEQIIAENVNTTPDDTDKIFVRNTDQIDTPYEFTYFLYDTSKPWRTFQMLEEYDTDDTRFILKNLSPHPNGPPKHGRVNPYSPHTNVIASVFMDMPFNEFNYPNIERLTASQATTVAKAFIEYISNNGWPDDASQFGTNNFGTAFADSNPWFQESFFRNTYELFNPRDSFFTLLLVAQNGNDINSDGIISDNEIRGTQKAVVYIWRDPKTKQVACVFYGLSDTLQSSIGNGMKWSELLWDFKP